MSRTAISAWYMDMCVNAPWPVTSPIAHTPSPARIHSSVEMVRALESRPIEATPSAAKSVRRPVATSRRSAISVLFPTWTLKCWPV